MTPSVPFIPNLQLNEQFYREVVLPVLDTAFPDLAHSAALIGHGSEVLGFDTPLSTDHDWGPRLVIFLSEVDEDHYERYAEEIVAELEKQLPATFLGYPVRYHFGTGDCLHQVRVWTMQRFVKARLGFDIAGELSPTDWLSFPQQRLLTLTKGMVYHDGVGIEAVRARFAYYPQDVWLYLLAASWKRIGQEDHLMSRAGSVGDEIGSAIIGARLVREVMRLSFLMERVYAPYPKWFGSAFGQLRSAAALTPFLQKALIAPTWQERETALCGAYECLAQMHNALNITPLLHTTVRNFHDRPFRVIDGLAFAEAIVSQIEDTEVKQIAATGRLIGSIDQISDSTDFLEFPPATRVLSTLWVQV
jgi:Domain of unknown function (DUF4037)